jgi:hypothetical protein
MNQFGTVNDGTLGLGTAVAHLDAATMQKMLAAQQEAERVAWDRMAPSPQPAQPSSVAGELGSLEQALMQQNELLQMLATRLGPVLRIIPLTDDTQTRQPDAPACPLAERLAEGHRMIGLHNQILSDLVSRIALE